MELTTDRRQTPEFSAPDRTAVGPILLACDGSPASAAPFAVARQLAERAGARLVVALEPLSLGVPPFDPSDGATDHHGSHAVPLVVTGHPHHGAMERMTRGETPIGIARTARVPVLSIPPTMQRLPRCVVVGVGLGDAGTRIGAISHALFGDAVAIHLVHVRTAALPRHDREVREEDHAEEADGERAFRHVLGTWRLPADVPVEMHERVGRPGDELLAAARTLEADLLVVGLSLRADGPHLPHRSLASRLYREWPGAVLLVPVNPS